MAAWARSVVDGVLDFTLPRVCVECGGAVARTRSIVCDGCWRAVARLTPPWCDRCGYPAADASATDCRWCTLIPPSIDRVRSWCWVPEATGGALVHHLKYGGWWRIAEEMADRLSRFGTGRRVGEPVRIVAVPLGVARRRERGFNQAEALAAALARRWGASLVPDALQRIRETRSQVLLTPDARSANVQGAFIAGPGMDALRGSHVVLVDDVITTAATLTASAGALGALGVLTISFVTFGRARAAWDRGPTSRSATP
jgi:ComF family protein